MPHLLIVISFPYPLVHDCLLTPFVSAKPTANCTHTFQIPDPYFVLSQIALGCEAQEVADGAKGRRRRRARLKAGKEAWEQGHYNGGYGNSLESLQSVTGVGPLNLKVKHFIPRKDREGERSKQKGNSGVG